MPDRRLLRHQHEASAECAASEKAVREHEDVKEKYDKLKQDHKRALGDLRQVHELAQSVNFCPTSTSETARADKTNSGVVANVQEVVQYLEETRTDLKKQTELHKQTAQALAHSKWIQTRNDDTIFDMKTRTFVVVTCVNFCYNNKTRTIKANSSVAANVQQIVQNLGAARSDLKKQTELQEQTKHALAQCRWTKASSA